MGDSLRRNSSFLILSQAINAGSAFIFWIICAHLFTTKQVGLATAFISFGGLVSAFTNLGLPSTIIRFLPRSKHKGDTFIAALLAITIASLVGGGIALLLIGHLSPRLAFVKHDNILLILLLLLVLGNTVSGLMDGTLMAFRKGQYILGKALITNIPRILLPFLLVGFAVKGMVAVYVIMIIIGTEYNLYIMFNKILVGNTFEPKVTELIRHKSYAFSNYFGGMFGILPSTLVPIIVLNKLGADQAAYFYMAMQIATFLNVISSSTSQALMAESSQDDDSAEHRKHLFNAAKNLSRLLGAAIVGVVIVSWPLLHIYGAKYATYGYVPLVILAIASAFVAINWLGDTVLNIQKRSRAYFLMNGFNALAVIIAVYLFGGHGLIAVSVSWLTAQLISAIVYVIIFARDQTLGLLSRASTSS